MPAQPHESAGGKPQFADTADFLDYCVDDEPMDRTPRYEMLIMALEDYRLWEPGKKGHAAAHRRLFAVLDQTKADRLDLVRRTHVLPPDPSPAPSLDDLGF